VCGSGARSARPRFRVGGERRRADQLRQIAHRAGDQLRSAPARPELPPLQAKRTAAIQKSLEEAQAARADAARQQEENAARLRTAYQEANAIREQALKEAGEEQRKLVEGAQAEARRLVEGARAQTEADIRRAREELRREVATLAVAVAEKLVRKSLQEADHRKIVDDAIAKIGA
jgi:F-type H+-transporting ATPase subunit b